MGCSGMVVTEHFDNVDASHNASGATDDATITHDASASDDASGVDDAALDAARPLPGPDASCPRSGTFTCGSTSCNRATEFCSNNGNYVTCQPLADLPSTTDSGVCAECPTCACVPPSFCSSPGSCFEDNFGGLTITCSHGGCYGSPPARLDRLPIS
jgi:hypothetical protein